MSVTGHRIVETQEWISHRKELLAKEKEFTRLRDELSQARRELPWQRVTKDYSFLGPQGRQSLADLFDGRNQLIVYHFMFGPDWGEGCKSCSFWADGFNGIVEHLRQRDVTLVAVSRGPLAKLQAFAQRMGWSFPWVSSADTDFNFDYCVSFDQQMLEHGQTMYNFEPNNRNFTEMPGISVFYKDDADRIYHTYSCYARGLDMLNAAYHYLDLVPKGRDEENLPYTMSWVRIRDQYER